MTKIELFESIKSFVPADRTDLTEFIDKQISQVIRKNAYVSPNANKPTAKQTINAGLKCDILCTIAKMGQHITLKQIAENTQSLVDMNASTQKVSALMTQLVNSGEVSREVEKKVSYFSLPAPDAE